MDPILIDFPEQFETERLLIRKPNPGDGLSVYESIQASRNELKQWLPFAQKDQTKEDTESNIRESHAAFIKRDDLRFLAFLKDSGQFVCSSGLHRLNWQVRKFEIGYWADTRFSGKGYVTETVAGITDFAFKELKARRLEIRCDSKNRKSRTVPERLGFHLEGILQNEDLSVDETELRDTCIYAKIKK
ncbi:GNAT family N-acetyltransferase [Halobacillus massiliensis]|uniref:GNAT family N-acetyltransferase n=1 Tax=Halobacillus massiliensis TaxID=1926286 RepID=UPI0009E29C60|nr:GNAT family N-acetyltransferase [Halobacillus massiliensis]